MKSIFPAPAKLGILAITGARARDFLHGQVSCDIRQLTPSMMMGGAACNPQGRVITSFHAFLTSDGIGLIMDASVIKILCAAWEKFLPFYQVTCADISAQWRVHGVATVADHAIASALFADCTVGFAVTAADTITTSALPWPAWHLQRIHQGLHLVNANTSGRFTPQMLNYPDWKMVDFHKGCYVGQEVIARTHYRGRVKRRVRSLRWENVEEAQQSAAPVLEAVTDEEGKIYALAMADA